MYIQETPSGTSNIQKINIRCTKTKPSKNMHASIANCVNETEQSKTKTCMARAAHPLSVREERKKN